MDNPQPSSVWEKVQRLHGGGVAHAQKCSYCVVQSDLSGYSSGYTIYMDLWARFKVQSVHQETGAP